VVKEISGEGRAAAESSFDVVWASDDWIGWMAETEAIAPFLFQSLELDDFLTLGPGAKERYIEEFWARHDPTPGPGNATREEFVRRIEYTNQNFSTTLEPGMRSDRGRVYIKFGEPDEVRREVVPVQGNDINAALAELERGTGGELRGNREIDPEDSRAFEVWVYDYRGYELFESPMSRTLGQQFVFVDDLGVGDFRMIRSSERDDF
jgi:GWxTD domain-containing protein